MEEPRGREVEEPRSPVAKEVQQGKKKELKEIQRWPAPPWNGTLASLPVE